MLGAPRRREQEQDSWRGKDKCPVWSAPDFGAVHQDNASKHSADSQRGLGPWIPPVNPTS